MQLHCLVIQNHRKRNLKPREGFLFKDFGRVFVHKIKIEIYVSILCKALFPVLKKIQYTVYTAPRFASLEFPTVFLWKVRLASVILQDFSDVRRKF